MVSARGGNINYLPNTSTGARTILVTNPFTPLAQAGGMLAGETRSGNYDTGHGWEQNQ